WKEEGTPNFIKATGADQFTYLYSNTDPSIVNKYHGTPCPTIYVIDEKQKIVFRSRKFLGGVNTPNVLSLTRLLGLKYSPPKGIPQQSPVAVPMDESGEPDGLSSAGPAPSTAGARQAG